MPGVVFRDLVAARNQLSRDPRVTKEHLSDHEEGRAMAGPQRL